MAEIENFSFWTFRTWSHKGHKWLNEDQNGGKQSNYGMGIGLDSFNSQWFYAFFNENQHNTCKMKI